MVPSRVWHIVRGDGGRSSGDEHWVITLTGVPLKATGNGPFLPAEGPEHCLASKTEQLVACGDIDDGHLVLARVPGGKRMQRYPSTVAYMAALMLHRYRMLGILDSDGMPLHPMGVLAGREGHNSLPHRAPLPGAPCPDCGAQAVMRRDGCDTCTACGWVGACG